MRNGCENIAITGPGKLYGHGNKWWDWNKRLDERDKVGPRLQEQAVKGIPPQERIYGSPDAGLRPQFISPINCRNVLLEGFTIAEPGPFWTIHFLYCENVIARGLTIHTRAAQTPTASTSIPREMPWSSIACWMSETTPFA